VRTQRRFVKFARGAVDWVHDTTRRLHSRTRVCFTPYAAEFSLRYVLDAMVPSKQRGPRDSNSVIRQTNSGAGARL